MSNFERPNPAEVVLALMMLVIGWTYCIYVMDVYMDKTLVMAGFVVTGVRAMEIGHHMSVLFSFVLSFKPSEDESE